MGNNKSTITVITSGILLASCTAHPLPEDNVSARDASARIVKHVRCEFQQVLLETVVKFLTVEGVNPEIGYLARQYGSHKIGLKQLREKITRIENKDLYDEFIIERLNDIGRTQIAYQFIFDITETNDNSLDATVNVPFSRGNLKLGLSSGGTFKRQGKRQIDQSEKFAQLLNLDAVTPPDVLTVSPCDPPKTEDGSAFQIRARRADRIKPSSVVNPIGGRIGIAEYLSTFIDLKQEDLAPGSGHSTDGRYCRPYAYSSPTSYKDELIFTSTLKSGIKPQITLDPVVGKVALASLNGDSNASRIDKNSVTITLTRKPRPKTADPRKVKVNDKLTLIVPSDQQPTPVTPDNICEQAELTAMEKPTKKAGRTPTIRRSRMRAVVTEPLLVPGDPRQNEIDANEAIKQLKNDVVIDTQRRLLDLVE